MMVADASAVLAVLLGEAGAEEIAPRLKGCVLSAVNLCEILTRTLDGGIATSDTRKFMQRLELSTHGFDAVQAQLASDLRADTRALGLSLGDRACLALGRTLGLPVFTADRSWGQLSVGVEVRLAR